MKKPISAMILAAGLLLGAQVASAAEYVEATVYRVAPAGVWVKTTEGATWIPGTSATYKVGSEDVVYSKLSDGGKVNVYYAKEYKPNYIPNEYYALHPDWEWDKHWSSWEKDRNDWVRDSNGTWKKK